MLIVKQSTMSTLLASLAIFAQARLGMNDAQSVFINPRRWAVLGPNSPIFRNSSGTQFFNPTNTPPPFFQILDPSFTSLLGATPSLHLIASNDSYAFAHEAPIWVESTDEVFFAANSGGALGMSDINHNSKVGKISLKEAEAALTAPGNNGTVQVKVMELNLPDTIQMTNGGTGPLKGSLLLSTSGRGLLPPSLALVNPHPPYNATVLLDNFYGRQFNSLNDVKVHPRSGKIFVVDVGYGYANHFRPIPLMPNQVYRFDQDKGTVRVVADGFDRCNGLAFTGDGKIAYVTDTGAAAGSLGNNQTQPATIYAFDVHPTTQAFANRRVFAYSDSGIPDGIQMDKKGNVWSGNGDGVHIWNSEGTLIGKIFLNTTSANFIFAGKGRVIVLAETKIYLAKMAAEGLDLGSF